MATPPQLNAASAVSALQEYQKLKAENKTAWIGLEVKDGKQCFKAQEVTIFTRLARLFGGGGWDFKKTTEALTQAFKDPSCKLDSKTEIEVRKNILGSASRWNESAGQDKITNIFGREMSYSPQIAKIEKYCKNFEITQNPKTTNMQIEYRFTSEKEREMVISKLHKEGILESPKLNSKQTPKEGSFFVLKLSPTPSARLLGPNYSTADSARILMGIRDQSQPSKPSPHHLQGPKLNAVKPAGSQLSSDEVKRKIFDAVPAAHGFQIVQEGKKLHIACVFFAPNTLSIQHGREQLVKIGTIREIQQGDDWRLILVDPTKITGEKFENIKSGLEALQRQQVAVGGMYVKGN